MKKMREKERANQPNAIPKLHKATKNINYIALCWHTQMCNKKLLNKSHPLHYKYQTHTTHNTQHTYTRNTKRRAHLEPRVTIYIHFYIFFILLFLYFFIFSYSLLTTAAPTKEETKMYTFFVGAAVVRSEYEKIKKYKNNNIKNI